MSDKTGDSSGPALKHVLILALAIVIIVMIMRMPENMTTSEYTSLATMQPMRFEYGVPVARVIKLST